VEYPQRNETNSTVRQQAEDMDLVDANQALATLRKKVTSMLNLIEKDLYNIYSTDVEFIESIDKEIMKKVLEFERDMKKIVVYSKDMVSMHKAQGRLFYD
jgi:hypothetical protein